MERFGQRSFGRIYGFVYSGLDAGLSVAPILLGPLLDRGMFSAVFLVLALYPWVAVSVKRCHDMDYPWWFMLLSFIPIGNLVLFVQLAFCPAHRALIGMGFLRRARRRPNHRVR